jgi:hypothetical protein
MNWLLCCYLVTVLISFLISLISFQFKYPIHLKLFSVFLAITVCTELIANFLLDYLNLKNNYIVYNYFILVQYPLLAYFFRAIIVSKRIKNIAVLFMFIFPAFWLVTTIFVFGLNNWNSYSVMLGDLFVICVASRYLFELFTSDQLINFTVSSEFWIAAALFFYCCCEIPITGLLNYLYGDSGNSFLTSILQILNIIMYLIFIYAFLCRRMTSTTKSSYLP